jgi:hypothetical protein
MTERGMTFGSSSLHRMRMGEAEALRSCDNNEMRDSR